MMLKKTAISKEFKGLLLPRILIAASILCFLISLRGYFIERQLTGSTITTEATVIDKELWAVYPVHYEITYSFSAASPEEGELRDYTGTTEVNRNFYNLLRLGDQIVITYPSGDPYRSVLGPEFRNAAPWAFPLFGLVLSVALFLIGRHRLLAHRHRQFLVEPVQPPSSRRMSIQGRFAKRPYGRLLMSRMSR